MAILLPSLLDGDKLAREVAMKSMEGVALILSWFWLGQIISRNSPRFLVYQVRIPHIVYSIMKVKLSAHFLSQLPAGEGTTPAARKGHSLPPSSRESSRWGNDAPSAHRYCDLVYCIWITRMIYDASRMR